MIDMQERELWGVAVFRLRESANRIFSLATRVRSVEVRAQLLRIYEQLRAEESKLAALADAAQQPAEQQQRSAPYTNQAVRGGETTCAGENDD